MATYLNRIMIQSNNDILVNPSGYQGSPAGGPGAAPLAGAGGMDAPTIFQQLARQFDQSANGACNTYAQVSYGGVAATATVTITGNGTNGDTLVIAGVTLTIVTTVNGARQAKIGTSAANLAQNIANMINNYPGGGNNQGWSQGTDFLGICSATVSGAVITLTIAVIGVIGNTVSLTKTSTAITLTTLFGAGTLGTEGTPYLYRVGM